MFEYRQGQFARKRRIVPAALLLGVMFAVSAVGAAANPAIQLAGKGGGSGAGSGSGASAGSGSGRSGDMDRDRQQSRDRMQDQDQLRTRLRDMDQLRERIRDTNNSGERARLMQQYRDRIQQGMRTMDRMRASGPGPNASEQTRLRYMQQRQDDEERLMQHMWEYREQVRTQGEP